MSKKLVVSADDFGFSEAYSEGALKAYREGVVTVLSLMVNMPAARYAVNLRDRFCPEAQMVQHTNFVHGKPVSNPDDIPSLVDENGCFYRSSRWRSDNPDDLKCRGNVYPTYDDLRRETLAQLHRFRELTGSFPVHFEGHSTMTAPMKQAFRDVGRQLGIHCRGQEPLETKSMVSCAESWPVRGGHAAYSAMLMRGSTPEDWESDAFGVLECPYEIAILHFHPGWIDQFVLDNTSLTLQRCRDLVTVCDSRVRRWIEQNGIELVDYSAVYR